eukprot:2427098-Prymnesium_polylepis.1
MAVAASACAPANQLIFMHAPKSGGISLDQYMLCRANGTVSVRLDDGQQQVFNAERGCRPTIISTHGRAFGRTWYAPEWRSATRVFVLRDPVQRIYSFYNYIARWYAPFRAFPISTFFNESHTDPNSLYEKASEKLGDSGELECLSQNCGCTCTKYCRYCWSNLFNGMTQQLSWSPIPATPWPTVTEVHFREAVQTLNASIVGNLTDVQQYIETMPFWPAATAKQCPLQRDNPTTYVWPKLDAETERLIARENSFDMRLYKLYVEMTRTSPGPPAKAALSPAALSPPEPQQPPPSLPPS